MQGDSFLNVIACECVHVKKKFTSRGLRKFCVAVCVGVRQP